MSDKEFLQLAIDKGNEAALPYNFGAVVVMDGKVISAEHARVHAESDPSLHSEVSAIANACKKLGNHHIDGAVLYASHEPCGMCLSCASWAHINRVVFAHPKADSDEIMYDYKVDIYELNSKLRNPIQIEQITIAA